MRAATVLWALTALSAQAQAVYAEAMFPINQSFVAVSVNGADTGAIASTLEVVADNGGHSARGTGGCNGWSGSLELDGQRFALSRIRSTRMACAPDVMAAEQRFFSALQQVRSWRMDGQALVLEGGGASMQLVRQRERR